MSGLDRLLPVTEAAVDVWTWMVVDQLNPLRLRRDGAGGVRVESDPENLAGPLERDQRVLTVRTGRRLIVLPMSGVQSGDIKMWPADVLPAGWVLCDGRALSRSTNSRLFAIVGTTYGPGDGSATFNVPNFSGRSPVGPTTAYSPMNGLGKIGGAFTHTLTNNQMPSHTHIQNAHTHVQNAHKHTHDQSGGGSLSYSEGGGVAGAYTTGFGAGRNNTGILTADAIATNQNTTATNQSAGGGEAHPIVQPFTTVNFIIRT